MPSSIKNSLPWLPPNASGHLSRQKTKPGVIEGVGTSVWERGGRKFVSVFVPFPCWDHHIDEKSNVFKDAGFGVLPRNVGTVDEVKCYVFL